MSFEQGEITKHFAGPAVDRLGRQGRRLIAEIAFDEHPGLNAGSIAAAQEGQERCFIRNRHQHKRRVRDFLGNQVTGGEDAGVNGLNGLLGEGKVAANCHVNVRVG